MGEIQDNGGEGLGLLPPIAQSGVAAKWQSGVQIVSGQLAVYHDRRIVALVGTSIDRDDERTRRDARLIAAAPELLEALRECQRVLLTLTEPDAIRSTTVINAWAQAVAAEQHARAAISKASPHPIKHSEGNAL